MLLHITAVALLLVSLSGAAQQPGFSVLQAEAGSAASPRKAHPPKAVTHNGHPALEYEGVVGSAYIEYFMRQGEPALGFAVAQGTCQGHVYVTRTRITGDFSGTTCESFDVPRDGATAEFDERNVVITSSGATYRLVPQVERGPVRRPAPRARIMGEVLVHAVRAFGRTFANVRRAAMESQVQAPQLGVLPASGAARQTSSAEQQATLTIHSDPGDTQVYINDQGRGFTNALGDDVIALAPGSYRVRLSLPGYEDFEQAVTLLSGQKQEITAKLQLAGPPPFSADDVSEMLHGKMSPKRIATLVQERGVNFSVDPDTEKRLRAAGATGDLLLVIATNKKK